MSFEQSTDGQELEENTKTTPVKVEDKEIFEKKFGPQDYMRTYYPENLDTEKLLWASGMMQKEYASSDRVSIQKIMEVANIPAEVAENLAIFDFQREISRKLLEAYPQDKIEVLDVGGGPTIYQHMTMSLEAGNITHSEFLEQNRAEVIQWLNDEDGAYNWDAYFDLVKKILQGDKDYQAVLSQQLENDDPEIASHARMVRDILGAANSDNFKAHLRERLNGKVVSGDVFRSDLGLTRSKYDVVSSTGREGAVDMVTSNFTIESATSDRSKWEEGVKNIASKVKKGGFLALTAIRNAEWYQVGEEKMPAVKVDEEDIQEILQKEGFEILQLKILEGSKKDIVGYDGMVFCFARLKV